MEDKALRSNKNTTAKYINNSVIKYLGISLVCILFTLYGFHIMTPTKAPEKNVSVGYEETLGHLRVIAKEPHQTGTRAIEEVRMYLMGQFDSMGVSYEAMPFERDGLNFVNYLVKLDAQDTEDAVMFVSHYDSVSRGPGACDDGISVASMLTVLREMCEKQDLKNDMYFLFTDGEEFMMYGAQNFLEEHNDQYKDIVKLVINLESRGTCGNVLMFETSKKDKNLVNMIQKAVHSGSTAFSFAAAAYKTMDNDTDLSEFLARGYTGINYAVVDGGENYHTEYDNYNKLNKDTAYMYYKTTNELAKYVKNMNLTTLTSKEDGVYFPIMKGRVLLLSSIFVKVVGILAILAWLAIMVIACLKKKLRIKKVVSAFAVLLINCAISYGITRIIYLIIERKFRAMPQTYQQVVSLRSSSLLWQVGIMLLLCCFMTWLLSRFLGNVIENMFVVTTLVVILQIALYILFDAVIYVTTFILIPIEVLMLLRLLDKGNRKNSIIYMVSILCIGVIGIIFVPILRVIYPALYISAPFLTTGTVFGLVEAFLLTTCMLFVEEKQCL